MATQYTVDRVRKLELKGYRITHINLSAEEIKTLRLTHFVTEMRYTTEVRGEPDYKIWTRPKGALIEPGLLYAEVPDIRTQDLVAEFKHERSMKACREQEATFIVKTSNGYGWMKENG